jgi:hypothetical protein
MQSKNEFFSSVSDAGVPIDLRILKSMPVELFVADRDEQRLRSAGIAESHCSTDACSLFRNIGRVSF